MKYQIKLNKAKWPQLVADVSIDKRVYFSKPEEIAKSFCECFNLDSRAEIYVTMICFTNAMKITGFFEISHGSGTTGIYDIRGIFTRALLSGASKIAVAHNHPSGDPTPTFSDIESHDRLVNAAEIMDIDLIDDIIIGDNGKFYSFRSHHE